MDPENKPIHLSLGGRRWKLRFVEKLRDFGQCDHPDTIGKEIRIRTGQTEFELLDSLLHEFNHSLFWQLDESVIAAAATDLAKALTRLGYRRTQA